MSESTARQHLIGFLKAMKDWELDNFRLLSNALENEDLKQARIIKSTAKVQLENIFEMFCAPKKGDKGRLLSTSLQSPTTYDPERDELKLSSESKNKFIYEYRQKCGLEAIVRFTIAECGGQWKINSAEFFTANDAKWNIWTL